MDKTTAEKVARNLLGKGYDVIIDETRKPTRITARKTRRGQGGSLSHLTAQPEGKAVVDKAGER